MRNKILGSIIFAILILTLSSCGKDIIEKEIYLDSTVTRTFDIMSKNWKSSDSYFTVSLDVPEITKDVCDYGTVQCFIVYDDGVQASIPMQRYLSYEYVDETTKQTMVGYYQKLIDFEYSVGQVNLFYTMSDFYYESNPEEMTVRVVVHY